jgi:hypothetical protein
VVDQVTQLTDQTGRTDLQRTDTHTHTHKHAHTHTISLSLAHTHTHTHTHTPEALGPVAKVDALAAVELAEVIEIACHLRHGLVRAFEPPVNHVDAVRICKEKRSE